MSYEDQYDEDSSQLVYECRKLSAENEVLMGLLKGVQGERKETKAKLESVVTAINEEFSVIGVNPNDISSDLPQEDLVKAIKLRGDSLSDWCDKSESKLDDLTKAVGTYIYGDGTRDELEAVFKKVRA